MNEITLLTPAKINLCLNVLAKRPDGYHDVEMLMQAVGLYDTVTVRLGGSGISVVCDHDAVPSGEGNIAWRAAHEMLKRTGRSDGVAIVIKKTIPVAAGLGGGSSDAAAVLAACNHLLDAGLGTAELAAIGARLGMDVPFFFSGPLALAQGRGELLTRLAPLSKFWVLLVNPGFGTSTAWAYNNVNLGLTKKVDCNKIAGLTIGQIADSLHNDLEAVTAEAHPVVLEMEQALLASGALGARMSGSGPTVFGVFQTEAACRSAAEKLLANGWHLYPAQILTEPLYEGLI